MNNKKMIATAVFVLIAFCFGDSFGAEYFPPELAMPARVKRSELPYYSEILELMKEPPLWPMAMNPNVISYRFIYLPHKGPREPVVLRLDRNSKTDWILTVKEADYSPDESEFRVNRTRQVAQEEVGEFQRLFTLLQFWELPTVGALEAEAGQLDGTDWILEAVENGRYHFVRRRTPKDSEGLWVSVPEYTEEYEKLRREEGYPYIDRTTSAEVNKKLVAVGEFLVGLSGLRLEIY